MEVVNYCQTPQCGKPSTLQCPTCVKLGLPSAFFCSQQCFKDFFPIHKLFHKKPEDQTKPKDTYKYSGPLRPGVVSKRVQILDKDIPKPDYAYTGIPKSEIESKMQKQIAVNSEEEIENLRKTCLLGRKVLDYGHSLVRPGITTDEIDRLVHAFIIENKAYPSPLNYHGFPKSLCTSINEVICHGIPDDRPLENGDIVNLDITVFKDGVHADLNETYTVGQVAESSKFLIEKTYRSLEEAIKICKPGVMYRDIGNVIGKYVEQFGLSVTTSYTGHGIGKLFHVAPNVPHYRNNKCVGVMKAGHVFTIEPMINQGTYKDILWNDEWTAATADGQRSAQFEHTILITEDGCEVLTKRLNTSPPLCFEI